MRFELFVPLTLLCVALALQVSDAAAQAPGQAMPRAPEPQAAGPIVAQPAGYDVTTQKYGVQVMLADVAIFGAATGLESPKLGLGLFVSGGIVHALHGNLGRAGISVGMRVGMPIVAGLIGHAMLDRDDCGGGDVVCVPVGALTGVVVGFVSALVLDYTVVARKNTYTPRRQHWSRLVAPTATIKDGGLRLGLHARF